MKRLTVLTLFGALIGMAVVGRTAAPAIAQNEPGTITVWGTAAVGPNGTPPANTGVSLQPGMAALVTATGIVGLCGQECNEVGPDGEQKYADSCSGELKLPAPDLPPFSLVAQVGDGPLQVVGRGPRLVAGTGLLTLSVNDCYAANNSGYFAAVVTVVQAGGPSGATQTGSCRGRAEPSTTTVETEVTIPAYIAEGWTAITAYERVITTTNYKGVEGLVYVVHEIPNNAGTQTITSLSIPPWLRQAYNGNEAAIRSDLEAGLLKDRGPCV